MEPWILERQENQQRLRIIGKIKIGEKKKIQRNGKEIEIPHSINYFKASGKYAGYFDKSFGDKPDSIEIIFPSDDPFQVCYWRYEIRDGSRLWGYGDGKEFYLWDKGMKNPDGSLGNYKLFIDEDGTLMERVEKKINGKWQERLTLRFFIPKIQGILGIWEFSTKGSESTIPGIVSSFRNVLELAGTVASVPFDLSVEMVTTQKPGQSRKYPVVSLTCNINLENLQKIKEMSEPNRRLLGVLTEAKIRQLDERKMIESGSQGKIEF